MIRERPKRRADGSSPYNSYLEARGWTERDLLDPKTEGTPSNRSKLIQAIDQGALEVLTDKEKGIILLVGLQGKDFKLASQLVGCSLSMAYRYFKSGALKIRRFINESG